MPCIDRRDIKGALVRLLLDGGLLWLCGEVGDDEEVLRSDQGALERIMYYDLLVLLCSTQALENPHTCRVFKHLDPGAAPGHLPRLVVVATDGLLYTRQDSLCNQLRQSEVVDLRGWPEEESYHKGMARLVAAIAKADG